MNDFMAYFAFFLEILGGFFAYAELSSTFQLWKNGGKIDGNTRHILEHIFMLTMMIACNLYLIFWIFWVKGAAYGWNFYIVENHLWGAIFLFGILKITMALHLRRERLSQFI